MGKGHYIRDQDLKVEKYVLKSVKVSMMSLLVQLCWCCLVALVLSDSFVTPWTITYQVPLFMGFPRQEYWSRLPFPSPGDLPNPRVEPASPAWQADSLPLSHLESPGTDPRKGWELWVLYSNTLTTCFRFGLLGLRFYSLSTSTKWHKGVKTKDSCL